MVLLRKNHTQISAKVCGQTLTNAMQEAEVDRRTAIDAYQWSREICSSSLIHKPQIVLGDPGIVVQIDESLFRHKPKVCAVAWMYIHLLTSCYLQGPCQVFEMADTITPALGHLEVIQRHDAATLLPIINVHTVPASITTPTCGYHITECNIYLL